MSKLDNLVQKLCPYGVEYRRLGEICDLIAGGDVPRSRLSDEKTTKFCFPVYSNGIGSRSLYGWTDKAKILQPCVTIAARGTIGHCELRVNPFFPIVRLLCAIPNDSIDVSFLKYSLDLVKFQVPVSGIPHPGMVCRIVQAKASFIIRKIRVRPVSKFCWAV